jgi:MYXO-CTERM domain-containing protein
VAAVAVPESDARANGRFPAASQLVIAPTDPTFMALRTTFGIVVSSDGGTTWDWICERAVGYGGAAVEDPPIAVTANKTLVVGMQEGLGIGTSGGCDWRFVGGDLAGQPIIDLVVRPDAPHTVLALKSARAGANGGGDPLYASQVFQSTDDGATWGKLGAPLDATYVVETLEVAPGDPHRLYASGVKASEAATAATLFVSLDDGATWTPRAVPFDATQDLAPFVAAVDPTDPDRLYVRTNGTAANNLYVSADAGKTFAKILTAPQLLGFAQSADGSALFVGGPSLGLVSASRADFSFHRASDLPAGCLAQSGGPLFACSNEQDAPAAFRFLLGASTDNGATFAARLVRSGVRGPVACGEDAAARACLADWPGTAKLLGVDAGSAADADAGAEAGQDAGIDAASPPIPATAHAGCGCHTGPEEDHGSVPALALLALAVVGRRARVTTGRTQPRTGARDARKRLETDS